MTAPTPAALDALADSIIRDVAELPDRTSPDDWPEAMLVTADELRAIFVNALLNLGGQVKALRAERDQWREAHTREYQARIATEMEQSAAVSARAAAEAAADGAYLERNRLVAFLASLFPSGIRDTAIEGWDPAWNGCVWIDLPTGQCAWHYHDSQRHLFEHLPTYAGEWDGHSTDEKYERVARAAMEQKP